MNRKQREFRWHWRAAQRLVADVQLRLLAAKDNEFDGRPSTAAVDLGGAIVGLEHALEYARTAAYHLRGRRDTRGRHDRLADKTTIAAAVSADVKPLFRDSVESAAP